MARQAAWRFRSRPFGVTLRLKARPGLTSAGARQAAPDCGDDELGRQVMALRDAFVYTGEPFDVTAMRAMRERQIRHLVTGGTFNAKFSPADSGRGIPGAGVADHVWTSPARFAVGQHAWGDGGAGRGGDSFAGRLRAAAPAHTFLRWLVDSLRVVRGNTKDLTVPPPKVKSLAFLARRCAMAATWPGCATS